MSVCARLDDPVLLRLLDHREGDPVLDRSPGVLSLELDQDPDVRVRAEGGDVDQRRVADQVEHRAEDRHQGCVGRRTDRSPGHGREDGDLVGGGEGGVEAREVPHVVVVDVDVHELVQGAVGVDDLAGQARELGGQGGQRLPHRVAVGGDGLGSSGVRAEHCRQMHGDGHGSSLGFRRRVRSHHGAACGTVWRKADYFGSDSTVDGGRPVPPGWRRPRSGSSGPRDWRPGGTPGRSARWGRGPGRRRWATGRPPCGCASGTRR